MAELKMDIAPDLVRLSLEVKDGKGEPVLIDSCKKLLAQGVIESSKVLVDVSTVTLVSMSTTESTAQENVNRLHSALRVATLEPIPTSRSSLIRLPDGVFWPQLGAEPLFVRDFYQGCYEGPLSFLDPDCKSKFRKFIIRGNSGIGKSAFGAFLLYQAVKAGRTVVYTSDKVEYSFIMHSDRQVEVFGTHDIGRRTWGVLLNPSTVFICDGITPPVVSAFTVLITSPKRERYKEFFKMVDCEMLTFPVFYRHEIQDMLFTCFQHLLLEEENVWERYKKWGGIVRYVLTKSGAGSQQLLEDALTAIDLDDLIFHLGARAIESDDKASHRLLHLKPEGGGDMEFSGNAFEMASYVLARTELSSPYIQELVYKALEKRHFERLNHFLAQPILSTSYAKLYGDLYEICAAKALLKGGSFEVFDCSTGKQIEGGVSIPACINHVFRNVEDLRRACLTRQGQSTMYTPSNPSFTAVDAVLPGNILVNFTIDVKHEAKLYGSGKKKEEGIVPVANALGVTDDVIFYWVLPETSFRKACKLGKPFSITGQHVGEMCTLKQYFLCVPFAFQTI
jgi:hypothetical protein